MDKQSEYAGMIEYDETGIDDDASDKENKNRVRSTKAQLQKLDEFVDESDNESDKNARWNALTIELNQLGPPIRTTEKWKRVLSIRKYNVKRRDNHQSQQNQIDDCSASPSIDAAENENENLSDQVLVIDPSGIQCDLVMQQLMSISIENQNTIIRELRKTNSLLEDISKK